MNNTTHTMFANALMVSAKSVAGTALILTLLLSCTSGNLTDQQSGLALEGTWQLVSGTTIEKGDTVITDYTKEQSMIKVINKSHFAFLNHDLQHGKEKAIFGAGGGPYELKGDQYTEFLNYCNDRQWEGNKFVFTVKIEGDTLTQTGMEKIEGTGVDRMNIEKYVRLKV